ncbi:MAG: hypothetical protein IPP35_01835 [Elusimicrobia bacterium]|nr:hypothetical protein [Elusimicrobiota bacterium]
MEKRVFGGTDNLDRIVGLSPDQMMDLLVVTLNGLIQMTRTDIDRCVETARKISTNA